MMYVVTEGRIIVFPKAYAGKSSGSGHVLHIIGEGDTIVGNFPMRNVKFYGIELPEIYQEQYENQLRWQKMTPEERAVEKARIAQKAALPEPPDKPSGAGGLA